jgi:nucleobase:cation symporter-1, NCS1 family
MGTLDLAVLWGNFSIGILVIAAGAFLVTSPESFGLGQRLGPAALAIVIGSVVGALLLAAVGASGHKAGLPSMALLRTVLGRNGSYVATVINIVQLVGWTSFEFWVMGEFASAVSDQVFGFRARLLWLVVVAAVCLGLALLGPLKVVKAVLEKAASWVLGAVCIYLTVFVLLRGGFGPVWGSTTGAVGFAVAVDFVIAMPVSWLPVISDFNRFSASRRQNFVGTASGFAFGNLWLFLLGALLVLSGRVVDSSPAGLAAGILGLSSSALIGVLLLAGLLTGETPNAFADIYSVGVSTTNLTRKVSVRVAAIAVTVASVAIAAVVNLGDYETFLFLLGSLFVPLFAVVLADQLSRRKTPGWSAYATASGTAGGPELVAGEVAVRPGMIASWLIGFSVYQWIVPTGPAWWTNWVTDTVPSAAKYSWLGASLPSFLVAFVLASVMLAQVRMSESRN